MSIAIQTSRLTRVYRSYKKQEGLKNSIKGFFNRQYTDKVALAETSLKIEAGQIIGLVGANGAGKTTLLKVLSGLIVPTSGEATVLGFKPWERKHEFLRRISLLLGQKNQLWWDIAPKDSYELLSKIYGLDKKVANQRVEELSTLLQCEHVLTTQLRRLSLGERMKMEIIGALLHDPEILFLDEPTIGLDIVAQSRIRDFLKLYVQKRSPTVILTSHYMDDISILANRMLLISKGTLAFDGTVQEFVKTNDLYQSITFKYKNPLDRQVDLTPGVTLNQGEQEFSIKVLTNELEDVLKSIILAGGIQELQIAKVNLEDVMHKFFQTESRVF